MKIMVKSLLIRQSPVFEKFQKEPAGFFVDGRRDVEVVIFNNGDELSIRVSLLPDEINVITDVVDKIRARIEEKYKMLDTA